VVLQIVVNTLDYDMNIAEATAAPRVYQSWRGAPLFLEPGFSRDTEAILLERGHRIEPQQTMGSAQSIMVKDGLFFGAADSRRPGAAALGVQIN
jgi:gamma-glutamyltranspeptidase/glutathione hydrolase